jgi:hypothetical protein
MTDGQLGALALKTLNIETGARTIIDQAPYHSSDSDPAYSPDDLQISFLRVPENQYYVMSADGTGTPTPVGPTQPFPETGRGFVSPDGTLQLSIAPAPDLLGAGNQLFVTDLASGVTTRLTSFEPSPFQPHWNFQPVINALWQTIAPIALPAPPTVTHQVSPAAPNGSGGWYVTAPTVTFPCSGPRPSSLPCLVDGGASRRRRSARRRVPTDRAATALDSLGNVGHDTVTGLLVDLSPPTLTCSQSIRRSRSATRQH